MFDRRELAAPMSWGPFLCDIPPAERLARLRSLRLAAGMLCGQRATALVSQLRSAEVDETAIPLALAEFDRLGSVDQRRILSSYQRVTR